MSDPQSAFNGAITVQTDGKKEITGFQFRNIVKIDSAGNMTFLNGYNPESGAREFWSQLSILIKRK